MVNERPDRLEEIAGAADVDVRWLVEVMRLRGLVDAEHAVALELAQVAIQRLMTVTAEVAEVIGLLGSATPDLGHFSWPGVGVSQADVVLCRSR